MDSPSRTTPLAAFPGWWISVSCSCGRSAQLPMKLLAQRYGARTTVGDVARRLRCGECGEPPKAAEAIDHPQWEAPGYVGGGTPTKVPLLP